MTDEKPPQTQEEETVQKSPDTIKNEWDSGAGSMNALFKPEEMNIYVNKGTLEAYVFHSKVINYDELDHLEYDHKEHTIDVVKTDGNRIDLGVKIQWLLRPYLSSTSQISIVRTENRKSMDGKMVPFKHKNQEKTE